MRPRVGVSACLLGERVRHDGRHKHDPWIADVLAARVELVPVCPELEVGMGVPREPIQLVRAGDKIELRGVESRADHTARMEHFAGERVAALLASGISGYVFKSKSPSCGVEDTPVHDEKGVVLVKGPGMFARALREAAEGLPVTDEQRLKDPRARVEFLERVFAYRGS